MNKPITVKSSEPRSVQAVTQYPVRSGVVSGASVQSCLQDLYYWQNQYYQMCGGPKPEPYMK